MQCVFTYRRVLCVGCEWASAGRSSLLAFRRNCRSCGRQIRTLDRMSAGKPRGTRTPAHRSWPRKPPHDRTPYPRTGWVFWDLTPEKESTVRCWSVTPWEHNTEVGECFRDWIGDRWQWGGLEHSYTGDPHIWCKAGDERDRWWNMQHSLIPVTPQLPGFPV